MNKKTPFQPPDSVEQEVNKAFIEHLTREQKALTEKMMAKKNILRYHHGSTWKHPALPDSQDGHVETHCAEMGLPFQRLIDGDLSLIQESIDEICLEMKQQFLRSMYGLIEKTCDRTGNTVSASASGGLAEAFVQMLEKVEFGVDSDGQVSLPQVHVADPRPLLAALEGQPDEFHARVDAIIKLKTDDAIRREAERKEKFKEQP